MQTSPAWLTLTPVEEKILAQELEGLKKMLEMLEGTDGVAHWIEGWDVRL